MGCYRVLTLLVFLIDGVVDGSGFILISLKEGDSVFVNTGVTKQQHDKMLWYFNDTLIALINGEASTSCLYDGEGGRFREIVDVDYETGSLTIRDITSEHAGRYEANFIQSRSSGTSQSLNRNSKCDSTKITKKMSNIGDTIKTFIVSVNSTPLSVPDKIIDELHEMGKEQESDMISGMFAGVVAGVVVGVLLLASAGVIMYLRHRRSRNAEEEKKKLEYLLKV